MTKIFHFVKFGIDIAMKKFTFGFYWYIRHTVFGLRDGGIFIKFNNCHKRFV